MVGVIFSVFQTDFSLYNFQLHKHTHTHILFCGVLLLLILLTRFLNVLAFIPRLLLKQIPCLSLHFKPQTDENKLRDRK